MKAIEIHNKIKELNDEIEIPWHVWTKLNTEKKIKILGDQICLGADFSSLEEVRVALEWMVDQFGGKVNWKK